MAEDSYAVSIRLLGGFAVAVAGRPIGDDAPWGSRKAQALVKLLALAPGHHLTVEQLLDALWPDLEPAAARRAYYQALYLARRALDPARRGLLVARHQGLALVAPGGVAVDLDAFRAAALLARRRGTIAAHEAALALYHGALLPLDRYEDWSLVPRDEAQRLAVTLLLELARLHADRRDWDAACARLEELVAGDAANEEAHVALMRAHAAAGRRGQALAQFGRLRAALRADLDAEPEPATQQLYAALLAQREPAHDAPPPADTARPRHNLPAPVTTLFGREVAVDAVARALGESRLVTLTGAGGCGKTRLALAVARALLADARAHVWWVDLAALADPALVAGTVAAVLGLREQTVAAVVAALRERDVLLVLDNCEHLLAACVPLVGALLAACPAVRVLATSRAALRAAGEAIWRVPSLPVPADEPRGVAALAALEANPAVQLFAARARLARQDFALTPENARAVATICRRLDGLPLALELAAARVALLALPQLAARLDDALGLLGDGPPTALPRHRTLRATLDWSYHLLAPAGRAFLARLALFVGGFTLAAAEAICGLGDGTLDALAGLVERSLVQVEASTGTDEALRFRLLEPVRQYAAERLRDTGTAADDRRAHAAYYLRLAEGAEPEFYRARQDYWVALLARDHDNVRAALRWLRDTADWEPFTRLVVAFHRFWYMRAYYAEGRDWVAAALRVGEAAPADAALAALRPHVLYCAGTLAWPTGAVAEAEDAFRRALDLATARGLPGLAARARMGLGILCVFRGDYAAGQPYFAAGLTEARRLDDRWLLGALLNNLGLLALWQGDVAQARRYQDENLALCRATDDAHGIASALANLCEIAFAEGDLAAVVACADEALGRFAALGDRRGLAVAHNNRAVAARVVGDYPLAREHGEAALEAYTTIGSAAGMALARRILAETATARGELATARALYRQSLDHYRQSRHPRDVAHCLESLADLAWRDADPAAAARFAAAAGALRAAHALQPLPTDLLLRARLRAATRAALGPDGFDAASAVGDAWPLDEALAQALAYLGPR